MAVVYRCALCDDEWVVVDPQVSCTVLHPAGECCHYGEQRASEEDPFSYPLIARIASRLERMAQGAFG